MKTIFAIFALTALAATAIAGEAATEGTVSVLKNATTATAVTTSPAVTVTPTVACASCETASCETARAVRLSPWHTRRINRVADRQETRDARNCCSASCDCCKSKTLVVENRRKCACNCACK